MTLWTPSAAMTIGARSVAPVRDCSVTPSASCDACVISNFSCSVAPAATAAFTSA